ncbi:bile acid:sodium symporter family protein [Propioniciclava coleopterorum]|uniref:Bile acid:sodium symporter family protein n=1 Tax=Propioniciclava coleopterorum TaxID=2714937 RepID=A0A6G7Y4T3_9ACTN|nr:bile acid:sodium symporter family protein [Propioniciclava coleopterorum]QIK71793.1 bile acid:sodium symporter family protein [Propioniciclava coleopterorum]
MSEPPKTTLNRTPEDRSATVAVTVFPLLVLAAAAFGYFAAPTAKTLAPHVNTLLMVIMFGMGLTLKVSDFKLVLTRPLPILIGVVAQYAIMPLVGLGVALALQLPPDLAAGVILVGCAPGGTASNVVSYLAKADTALSVTMTSVSTLLAPILTPALTLLLAGQFMAVDGAGMALSILQIVLIPVLGGLVLRLLLPRVFEPLLPAMPWISVVAISGVVAAVVSGSADKVISAGLIVFAAVVLHNGLGYLLGYGAGRLFKLPPRSCRTVSIEVGMQNSGLAAGLAAQYFNPVAALPGAVFSIWHNLSGAMLAMYYRRSADRAQARDAEPVAS